MADTDKNDVEAPLNQSSATRDHAGSTANPEDHDVQRKLPSGTFLGLGKNQLHFGGVGAFSYFNFSVVIFKWLKALLHATTRRDTLPILTAKKCPATHEYGPFTLTKRPISTPICWQSGGILSMSYLSLCVERFLWLYKV